MRRSQVHLLCQPVLFALLCARLTLSARTAAIDILKEKLDAVLSDIELTQGDDGGVMGL